MSRLSELGPVTLQENASVDGGIVGNVAAIIEMAEAGDTPQSRIVCKEFWRSYDLLATAGLSPSERQFRALRSAMAAIGVVIDAPTHDN